MVFFIMLWVSVVIAILAQLPPLEFVCEMGRRANRFGVSPYAHSLLDVFLGDIGIDCAGGEHSGQAGQMQMRGEKEPAWSPASSSMPIRQLSLAYQCILAVLCISPVLIQAASTGIRFKSANHSSSVIRPHR